MNDPDDVTGLRLDVTVNGKVRTVPAFGTLADLIDQLGQASGSIATALNGQFVARGQRQEHVLRDGDRVTCFQAIVGG